jgi:hypothetical protein
MVRKNPFSAKTFAPPAERGLLKFPSFCLKLRIVWGGGIKNRNVFTGAVGEGVFNKIP